MTTEPNTENEYIDLKKVRENSGLTLKEVFEQTRVSVFNLEAIENGNFHLIPTPLYARNFIKTYADAVGVDSKPILQRYENYLQAMQIKEKEQKIEKSKDDESVVKVVGRYRIYLWIFAIIIVVVAVSLFVSIFNKHEAVVIQTSEVKKEPANPVGQLPIQVQPENVPAIALPQQPDSRAAGTPPPEVLPDQATQKRLEDVRPSPDVKLKNEATTSSALPETQARKSESVNEMKLAAGEESATIVIRATEETWIRIQADDQAPFQVVLKPGERISRKGERFNMDIGNAAGVKISYNGKAFENLGKTGQVIHLRLP